MTLHSNARSLIAIPLLLVACESLSTTRIAPLVPAEDTELTRGRRLYLTTCVRCHAPEPIANYTLSEWAKIMPEMIQDSKLSVSDAAAVTRYVREFAKSGSL